MSRGYSGVVEGFSGLPKELGSAPVPQECRGKKPDAVLRVQALKL